MITKFFVRDLNLSEQTAFESDQLELAKRLKRVLSISKTQIPEKREIFIDDKNQLYFRKPGKITSFAVNSYYTNSKGFYKIGIEGKELVFDKNCIVIEQAPVFFHLEKGKYYRLKNGVKVKIVHFEEKGEFASEDFWIGSYSNGTIRFDKKGQLLSHGREFQWLIESELKNVDLWVIVYSKGDNEFPSKTFTSESEADNFIKQGKLALISKTKVII
jgi:hypothetical protein